MNTKSTSVKKSFLLKLLGLILAVYNYGCISGHVAKSSNNMDPKRKVYETMHSELMLNTYNVTFDDVEHNLHGHQTILK